jgi:hypothetical protein
MMGSGSNLSCFADRIGAGGPPPFQAASHGILPECSLLGGVNGGHKYRASLRTKEQVGGTRQSIELHSTSERSGQCNSVELIAPSQANYQ